MFANLILVALFFTVITTGLFVFIFSFRAWVVRRDEYYMSKLQELRKESEEMRVMFRTDITEILNQVKKIIK